MWGLTELRARAPPLELRLRRHTPTADVEGGHSDRLRGRYARHGGGGYRGCGARTSVFRDIQNVCVLAPA